jgi:hypothetical protein
MMVGVLGFLAWRERNMPAGVRVPASAVTAPPAASPSASVVPSSSAP